MLKNWYTVEANVFELTLNNAKLEQIQVDAFNTWQFKSMVSLTINSQIHYIYDGALNGLNNLKRLVLSNTIISKFLPDTMAPLRSLETFNLLECLQKSEISIDNLFGVIELPTLSYVTVSGCNLTVITEKTFSGLKNVKNLTLTRNNIERIGERSFDAILRTLKDLNLARNELKSLPKNIFNQTKINVDLRNNPWHCDCENFDTLRKIRYFADEVRCKTPPQFAEEKISYLPLLCTSRPKQIIYPTNYHGHVNQHSPFIGNTSYESHEVDLSTYDPWINLTVVVHMSNGANIHFIFALYLAHLLLLHLGMHFMGI